MTTDTLFHSATFSPDTTANDLNAPFSPSAGELWYVDQVRIISDGSGGKGTAISAAAGVRASDTSAAPDPDGSNPYIAYQSGAVVDNAPEQEQAPLGVYLTENDAVRLIDAETQASSSVTITVGVTLRRIL